MIRIYENDGTIRIEGRALYIEITDAGAYYAADDVEAALQEIGVITAALAGDYVNVTGDTMTGALTVKAAARIEGALTNFNASLRDIGLEIESNIQGYGLDYITDKALSNCLILYNARTETGGIRVDVENDPDTFEIYLRGVWNTIIYDLTVDDGDFRHAPVSEEIYVWRGNSVMVGLNGVPTVQEYTASMGAYPADPIIDGGTF
jgi:hypothetical protein